MNASVMCTSPMADGPDVEIISLLYVSPICIADGSNVEINKLLAYYIIISLLYLLAYYIIISLLYNYLII